MVKMTIYTRPSGMSSTHNVEQSNPIGHSARGTREVAVTQQNTLNDAARAAGPGVKKSVQLALGASRPLDFKPLAENIGPRSLTLETSSDGKARISMRYPEITQLVLSGGGAKGAAYPGVVAALEAKGKMEQIETISGSSAGAITAALLASGMSGQRFQALATKLDFVDLIRHRNGSLHEPVKRAIEDGCRSAADLVAKPVGNSLGKLWQPLGAIGMVGDAGVILSNAPSNARGLEDLIRIEARKSVLQHLNELKERGVRDPAVDAVRHRLEHDAPVTFGDLRTLSKHIPAIKELVCTGTMMEKGRPQLHIFSADTNPDMDIAEAAHISGSFPIVFAQTEHQSPFGTHFYQDGGVMLNVPAPSVVNREPEGRPLPNPNALIVMFEPVKETKPESGLSLKGVSSAVKEAIVKAPVDSQVALQMRGLNPLSDQIVQVPLKNEHGDFSGMASGTLNFGMPLKAKLALQRDLQAAVEQHLDEHLQKQISKQFPCVDAAMLALPDAEFEALHEAHPNLTGKLHEFRAEAGELLRTRSDLLSNMPVIDKRELTTLVSPMDKLVGGNADKANYLARQIAHSQPHTSLGRIAEVAQDMRTNSPTLQAVKTLDEKQRIANAANRAISDIVYPASYGIMQTASNQALLKQTVISLRNASTREELNRALLNLAENYKSRSGLPIESKTVRDARDHCIRETRAK